MKKVDRFALALTIIIITLVVVFFGARKVDYNVDEIWNYGLANHVSGIFPDVEIGKIYTGMGPFQSFVEVNSDELFNYRNVFSNQYMDVHPPLAYCVLHTVCSLFPNTFSYWYGIVINIVWMWLILIVLYKLLLRMNCSRNLAIGMLLVLGTAPIFVNTILFIRMYSQLTFFAVLLAYLFKVYWDKELDKKFYFLYSIIIILGTLTQYYYLIFAFGICVAFALHLFFEKRTKELLFCVASTVVSATAYLVVWRHIIKHIFSGYRGQEAFGAAASIESFMNIIQMTNTLVYGLSVYLGGLFALFLFLVFLKRLIKKEVVFNYNYALVYSGLFYLLVVGKISPTPHFRYIAPVTFIFCIAAILIAREVLGKKIYVKKVEYGVVAVCLLANFIAYANYGFHIEVYSYPKERPELYAELADKDVVIYIENDWETIYYFEDVQHAKSFVFIDDEHKELLDDYNKSGYVWATINDHADKLQEMIDCRDIFTTGFDNFYLIN